MIFDRFNKKRRSWREPVVKEAEVHVKTCVCVCLHSIKLTNDLLLLYLYKNGL